MDDFTSILTAIFGGVVVIAIASVIVSRKSQAPQAIQAIGSSIGSIVAAAVNPVSANYGYGSGSQAATNGGNSIVNDIAGAFSTPISPGVFK
jgi:hypothetical protein